jgi:hypothetical protein
MAVCVRSITIPPVLAVRSRSIGGLRDAVGYVIADDFSAKYLPILACIGLFAGSYQTLVPLLADHAFHDAAKFTGMFFAWAGAGSLTAAVLLSSALGPGASERFIAWAPWTAIVALAVLAGATESLASGAAFYLLGFSLTFAATSTNATIQRRCPENVRGGLVGMYGMAYNGTMPFGYLLVGAISEALGVRNTFGAMAGVLATGVVAVTVIHQFRRVQAD